MRNPDLNHLRDAVRNEIAHAFELVGFAKPRDIARLVCAAHPENIYAIGGRLAEDALTDVARRELKNTTQGRESVSQMTTWLSGKRRCTKLQIEEAANVKIRSMSEFFRHLPEWKIYIRGADSKDKPRSWELNIGMPKYALARKRALPSETITPATPV